MIARNRAFEAGIKAIVRVDIPVVAIGNLTTGGTGKTPIVAAVVKLLQQQGHRPGIVSRGYGADSSGVNDEKRVLDVLCPGVPHLQKPDRVAAAKKLIEEYDATVVVLDDAFQHRRIHRDMNIVLIDATDPFGHDFLLPRGLLRESINGLKRADVVLITRADQVEEAEIARIKSVINKQNPRLAGHIATVSFQPTGLVSAAGELVPATAVEKKDVTVLTAIGNPSAFVRTCEQIRANVVSERIFPDHHQYSKIELDEVVMAANNSGNTPILTTLKDLVKIPPEYSTVMAVLIEAKIESASSHEFLRDELCRMTNID